MLDIREYASLDDGDATAAWSALEDADASPSVFTSLLWVRAWSREFGRDTSVRVFVAYQEGVPVALAPLFVPREGPAELAVNFLSLRGEFLLGQADTLPFVEHVLHALRSDGREVSLKSVPADCRTRSEVLACAREAGFLCDESESRTSPYLEISGSWEQYLETRTTKRVARWRKRVRKIENIEGMSVHRMDPSVNVDSLVDGFTDVEARSWKERQGTSIRGRGLEAYYHDLCRELASAGWFHPVWLERDGRMFAFVLGVVYRGALYALKTSFDEKYGEFSPGTPLFHYLVTDAFGMGCWKVDFLGEPSRWKSEWATGEREHSNLHLYPSGVSGAVKYIKETRVKPIARKILRGD
jgi:CelD/BcsL family acetyltransferase involved in cellulose biosynthesis